MNDHLAYPGRKLDIVHGCSPINLGLNASSSLNQTERDENDPDNSEMKLTVHYCDEHKEEAKKNPLK
ncbi:3246_t:CDS:2 [Entrophospora sp. SA101]|nr:3246_t:CDS:2 [Entrophospora sp. SA101]